METNEPWILRPDAKGRIALGNLARGVSSYRVSQDKEGRLILEPYAEIPAREQWLFQNQSALRQVRQGLRDAAAGKLASRGSFAEYGEAD